MSNAPTTRMRPRASSMPRCWLQHEEQGASDPVEIGASGILVGSAADNDMVIADPCVSKRHCRLSWEDHHIVVADEGSLNGTWVNGVRVERGQLFPGAVLRLGSTQLRVVRMSEAVAGRHEGVQDAADLILGKHPSIVQMRALIAKYAGTCTPVLISGETGTGKELVARALHATSRRRMQPFEAVNCAAIPRDLAESELFGHARGAFTGATHAAAGAFIRADGGTLLLDEVGDMLLELQPKLLRVLEQGMVRRVGADQPKRINVRVVAATHRDLERDAVGGRFRSDLYHRLAIGVIDVPPLRTRGHDVCVLADHFLRQCGIESGRPQRFSEEVYPLLEAHDWPGNVRELRNAVQRAAVNGGAMLKPNDFYCRWAARRSAAGEPAVRYADWSFERIRRAVYARRLADYDGNRAAAASSLGIPKSTFYDQLRAMGL